VKKERHKGERQSLSPSKNITERVTAPYIFFETHAPACMLCIRLGLRKVFFAPHLSLQKTLLLYFFVMYIYLQSKSALKGRSTIISSLF